MREPIARTIEALLATSEVTGTVSLDAVGEALGTEVASADDVETIFAALEARGRVIVEPNAPDAKDRLRRVLVAARELTAAGHKPTPAELATATGLDEGAVRAALLLGRVLGR